MTVAENGVRSTKTLSHFLSHSPLEFSLRFHFCISNQKLYSKTWCNGLFFWPPMEVQQKETFFLSKKKPVLQGDLIFLTLRKIFFELEAIHKPRGRLRGWRGLRHNSTTVYGLGGGGVKKRRKFSHVVYGWSLKE